MEEEQQIENKPSIKLTLNAKQQYQWEIRIVGLDTDELEKVNNQMKAKFKNEQEVK